jgi:hypothetical protein
MSTRLLSFFLELLASGNVVCRFRSRVSALKLLIGNSDTRRENDRGISNTLSLKAGAVQFAICWCVEELRFTMSFS